MRSSTFPLRVPIVFSSWSSRVTSHVPLPLLIAVVYFAGSVFILVAAALYVLTTPKPHSALGDYPSPWRVLTTVPGTEGPAVQQAGILTIRGVRCVEGNKMISVEASRYFTSFSQDQNQSIVELNAEKQSRAPGCNSADITIQLPENVKPGNEWRVDGLERSVSGGELKTYFSEPFQVVSK